MKTVVVTGASRGLGRAVARRFASEGFRVVGTSTSGDMVDAHDNVRMLRLDMTDPRTMQTALSELAGSSIDVLVNNAGVVLDDRESTSISLDVLRRTFEINCFGLIEFCERNLDRMVPGGSVINIVSNWGTFSDHAFNPRCPHYKLSKVTVNMYTKLLAERLKGSNIRVSALDVGWLRTDMGGPDAPKSAVDAAAEVFSLCTTPVPSGRLWHEGVIRDW